VFQRDGGRFPLSLEERAGVRTEVKLAGMRESSIAVDKPESRE
jgi:hypothetical protein